MPSVTVSDTTGKALHEPRTATRRSEMTTRTRKRTQVVQPQPDGPLQLAVRALHDAIYALCHPRPHYLNGHTVWLASRYDDLRDALDITGSRAGSGDGSAKAPCWVDALKLVIQVDSRTAEWDAAGDTPTRLRHVGDHNWRPQDCDHMTMMTEDIHRFAQAIDDLFAVKPIYLENPCPLCGHDFAYRLADTGERIRSRALAITVERAVCQQCHAVWTNDKFALLGKMLGTSSLDDELSA